MLDGGEKFLPIRAYGSEEAGQAMQPVGSPAGRVARDNDAATWPASPTPTACTQPPS